MLTKEELDAKGFAEYILAYGPKFYSDPENMARFKEWQQKRKGAKR